MPGSLPIIIKRLVVFLTLWCSTAFGGLSGCDDLSSIPMSEDIDFTTEIQPIFDDNCTQCHGGPNPIAFMDLTQGTAQIVGIPSFQFTELDRIEPGNPALSYLFLKINCSNQLSGDRMPREAPPLNLFDQALIRDWIAQLLIFRGGFE